MPHPTRGRKEHGHRLAHPLASAPHAPLRDSGASSIEASSEEAEEARSDIARLSWCKGKARSAGILSNAAASVLPWSGLPTQIGKVIDHIDAYCKAWIERCPSRASMQPEPWTHRPKATLLASLGFSTNIRWRYQTGSGITGETPFSTFWKIRVLGSFLSSPSGARLFA